MNAHDRAAQLASFAIDFPLSAGERLELDRHLGSCTACRALDAGFRSDVASLRAIAGRAAPAHLRVAIADRGMSDGFGRSWAPVLQLAWTILVVGLLVAALGVSLALVGGRLSRPNNVLPAGLRLGATIVAGAGVTPGAQPPGPHPGGGGQGITGAAFGEGSVWVTSATGVIRIDPSTNAIIATVDLGPHPTRIAFGAGAVWVTITGGGQVARIDPGSNVVTARIPVGTQPVGITFAEGSAWVAVRQDQQLVRIDPATNRVSATVALALAPLNVEATPGVIWVTSDRGSGFSAESALLRIDPSHPENGATIVPGSSSAGPSGELVADGDSVWFLVPSNLNRLDVATNRVTARIAVHNGTSGLAAGGGSIWAFSSQGFVERIDPTTNAVADEMTIALPQDGAAWEVSGAYGAGAVWVRSYDAGSVIRIDGP
ncbi:MAG TPA: hypothetical protein VJ506_00920 [Candidatus Limnocylindrales bacterium]|nr:hypothetical protein [Candidatus Limnocylindrales bacterium]